VTLICDGGERYLDTYYDDAWLLAHGHSPHDHANAVDSAVAGKPFALPVGIARADL